MTGVMKPNRMAIKKVNVVEPVLHLLTTTMIAYQAVGCRIQIRFNLPEAQHPDSTQRDAHPEVVVVVSEA